MYISEVVWYQKQIKRKAVTKTMVCWGLGLLSLFLLCGILKCVADRFYFDEKKSEQSMVEVITEQIGAEMSGTEGAEEITNVSNPTDDTILTDVDEIVMENKIPCIIIDAGHGGMDEGCSNNVMEEKEINLKLAYLLKNKLEENGFQVKLTREEDVEIGLAERVLYAAKQQGDLYISIHQNASEYKDISGIETWYYGDDEGENARLAELVQQYLILYTKAKDRGIVESDSLYVIRECSMPACLVETGFLSNAGDAGLLSEDAYLEKIVQGLADAIWYYFYPKKMYLTFDDGPNPDNTTKILDVLKEKNIKATFFVVGENVERYPEIVKRIAEEGHTIGIHCYNHSYDDLYSSADAFIKDFEKAKNLVEELTGAEIWCYRFPGGSINKHNRHIYQEIAEKMAEAGYEYFDWNAGFEDAVSGVTTQQIINNAKESTLQRKKVIMLAHDTVDETAQCLAEVLKEFPEYEFLPLTQEVEPIRFKKNSK